MNIGDQDQLYAGLADLADAAFRYYSLLRAQGFSANEALQLTMNWQSQIISPKK